MNIAWPYRAALFAAIVALTGCVESGGTRTALQAGARIGIVNLAGAQPRNIHLGTTVFNNFDEPLTSAFDFRSFIEHELVLALSNNTPYSPQVITLTPQLANTIGAVECSVWSGPLGDGVKQELSRISASQGIALFLVAVPDCGNGNPKIPGYGLYTHSMLTIDHAYAFSHVLFLRVTPAGEVLAPYVAPGKSRMVMFESPTIANGEMRNLPQPELDRIDFMVQNLIRNQIYGVVSLVR